jgi:multidrug efflux pump subunit AcrA (membrane-fusion protein)
MKQTLGGMLLGALLVGTAWLLVAGTASNDIASSQGGEATTTKRGATADSRAELLLDATARESAGMRTAALATAEILPELEAYGRVLDPTPLAEAVAALAAARAAASTATAEAARLRTLHANARNVSERSLDAAESDAAAAAAAASAARARLLGSWGSAIAQREDLASFVDTLLSGRRRLLRLDLPAGGAPQTAPAHARVEPLTGSSANDRASRPLLADLVGPAPDVSAGSQGSGFYFVVDASTPDLLPGRAVIGRLPVGETAAEGVLVPSDAVVRADGQAWIWLEDGDALVRTRVVLAQPQADGWLVADPGLAGRRCVVTGAQQLLSEELRDRLGGDEE